MSKYSELADRLEDEPTVSVGEMELFDSAAAALRELEAERDRLREAGVGYTQQTVDAITKEREALRARVHKLEAENARLREMIKDAVEWADRHGKEPWWLEAFRDTLEGEG